MTVSDREGPADLERFLKESICIEDLPLMVIEIGPDGQLLDANGACLKRFGYTQDEVRASRIRDLVPKCALERMTRCLGTAKKDGAAIAESVLRTREGQSVDVQIDAVSVHGPDGRLVKVRAFLTDVTRRKRLEEQLLQAQKMGSVGMLTAGVAHDFNNILAAILLAAQMINMEVAEDSVLKRQTQSIQSSAESGAELASQLLSFASAVQCGPRTVEPNGLVNEIVSLSKPSIDNSISIELKLDLQVWNIVAERNQMAQVVLNLTLNARDAMPQGGTLTFATENIHVEDNDLCETLGIQKGDYVRISVSDTGSGIHKSILGKIFEPFFTTKDPKRGTGLGLSIARGIVRKHDGGIGVSSDPGKGTTFHLYIPSSPEPETVKADEQNLEGLCGSEHILVVDDRDEVRNSASQMLGLWGYQVSSAPDGSSAIEIYRRQNNIDAVLMDLRMPGIDGIETHRRLKEIDDSVLVVLTSGYGHDKIVDEASSQGIAGFIKKPFKIEQFLSLLRRLLDERSSATGGSPKLVPRDTARTLV